jgi:GT2 family glycosyltransferase
VLGRILGALRSWLRRHPQIELRVLWVLSPIIPFLLRRVSKLAGSNYGAWFARWQAGDLREDDTIRAALGSAPPPFLAVLADGAPGERSRASLAAQVGIVWEAVAGDDQAALRRCAAADGLVIRLEAGETLERHALAALAVAARQGAPALVVYADEDWRDASGALRDPWLKTAFDPDRLLQQDALGSAFACSARLLLRHSLGHLRGHALALAACRAAMAEAGPQAVRHLPAVLLHRAAGGPEAPWRAGTDLQAVADALAAGGGGARIASHPAARPLRIAWALPDPAPKVSIIIPVRDRADLLRACLEGIFRRTDYPDFEVIVVDNGSTEPALHALLAEWSADPRLRVMPAPGPFNYAALNNRAADVARGEVLLLLNNDTEVRHPEWLREMTALAVRPDVGAVGARLLYPDETIQHAGVVLGVGGVAGHDFAFADLQDAGPQDELRLVRTVSAVTAACLAVRRESYHGVGGLDEVRFRVAYNDVDFCLKLRRAGLRNLVTPHAELLHRESVSRGNEFSPARRARWDGERRAMQAAWGAALDADPFFSPMLSLTPPFRRLADPPRATLPWRDASPGKASAPRRA